MRRKEGGGGKRGLCGWFLLLDQRLRWVEARFLGVVFEMR
jgi:hypothetical protein